jgi:hypothetical protein
LGKKPQNGKAGIGLHGEASQVLDALKSTVKGLEVLSQGGM